MRGYYNDIKDHGDPPQECLQCRWIRCLKNIQKEMNHFQNMFSCITPTFLEAPFLKLITKL
uniref:Sus2 n=1 Tax=Arundo donax TaxID=35708 RepID=A0A0A9FGW4_ARUDO